MGLGEEYEDYLRFLSFLLFHLDVYLQSFSGVVYVCLFFSQLVP